MANEESEPAGAASYYFWDCGAEIVKYKDVFLTQSNNTMTTAGSGSASAATLRFRVLFFC